MPVTKQRRITHYLTGPTSMPASSRTSLRTASSNDSPGSMKPAKHEYIPVGVYHQINRCKVRSEKEKRGPFGHDFCLPSNMCSPLESKIPIIMTGSVRGYAKLCSPLVEKHSFPSVGLRADVQLLFHPAHKE